MNKSSSSFLPRVLGSWQASSCSQCAVVERRKTCWADDSAALFPTSPSVTDGAGMQVSHQGSWESTSTTQISPWQRGWLWGQGFASMFLLPSYFFQFAFCLAFAKLQGQSANLNYNLFLKLLQGVQSRGREEQSLLKLLTLVNRAFLVNTLFLFMEKPVCM